MHNASHEVVGQVFGQSSLSMVTNLEGHSSARKTTNYAVKCLLIGFDDFRSWMNVSRACCRAHVACIHANL